MIVSVLIDKVKILCNFLSFFDVTWSIKRKFSDFNNLFRCNLWFLVVFWLLNRSFFDNNALLRLNWILVLNFVGVHLADKANTLNGVYVILSGSDYFLLFHFRLLLINFWTTIRSLICFWRNWISRAAWLEDLWNSRLGSLRFWSHRLDDS